MERKSRRSGNAQENQPAAAAAIAEVVSPCLVNPDGSYSVLMRVGDLLTNAFVDYYNDVTGEGYQRYEVNTPKRAEGIADYIQECKSRNVPYFLRDLECNARGLGNGEAHFKASDADSRHGHLTLPVKNEPYIAVIDGGTRLLGIAKAVERGTMTEDDVVALRLHFNESGVLEAVLFETINGKQKLVRSDLATRQLQVMADRQGLTDNDVNLIRTLLPANETWQLKAIRIAGNLNRAADGPWHDRIQMPGIINFDSEGKPVLPETKPIKAQSFAVSLKPFLEGETGAAGQIKRAMALPGFSIERLLSNIWTAIADVNPDYDMEPRTGVLWGAIGVTSVHIAVAKLVERILRSEEKPNLKADRFAGIFDKTAIADYEYWFTRKGDREDFGYPDRTDKGPATGMVGSANHAKLGEMLWQQMLAALEGRVLAAQQMLAGSAAGSADEPEPEPAESVL